MISTDPTAKKNMLSAASPLFFNLQMSTPEDDIKLPQATITKLISEQLPLGLNISKETREIISDCCLEFIHLLSSESNDVCERDLKKTITGDHVISALESLGFDEFIDHVKLVYQQHQQQQKEMPKKVDKLKQSGLTDQELMEQQRLLFQEARKKMG